MSSGFSHKRNFTKPEFRYNVTISNELITASKKLTVVEKRLLYIILAGLKQKNKNKPLESYTKISPDDSFFVSVEYYAELCQISIDEARLELKDAAKNLYERSIYLSLENKDLYFRWISERAIYENGSIELKFSSRIIPYISELEQQFRSLQLGTMLSFKSIYASELYEVFCLELRTHFFTKIVEYSIDQLRFYLGVGETLQAYKNFKAVALIPACREIERNNLLRFIKENDKYFEEITYGKKVIGVRFKFTFNMTKELRERADLLEIKKERQEFEKLDA